MSVEPMVKSIVASKGLQQKWVVARMNSVNPSLNMSCNKFSAIVCGYRKMTGDELLAFCQAVEVNPDVFLLTNESTS